MSSRINLDPTGNRGDRAKKPATESTPAQGISFYEELYFPDTNVHIPVSHLSQHSTHYPGCGPRVGPFSDRNINPGGVKQGEKERKRSQNPY